MYTGNRGRNRRQPQQSQSGPTVKELLYQILYRQSVQGRMLVRSLRYGRIALSALSQIHGMESNEMFNVQRLIDAAKAQTDAVVAMKGVLDKALADLRDAQDDPEQLEAALTAFEANTAVMAAAAASGTPVDAGPVPPVVVTPGSQGGGSNEA